MEKLTKEEVKALLKTLDKWELETSITVSGDTVRFCGGCIVYTTSLEGFSLKTVKYGCHTSTYLVKGEVELCIKDSYEE